MKSLQHIALILLLLCATQARAEVNCTAIATFERLHDAQIRLSRYQTPSRFILDSSIVAQELRIAQRIELDSALGSSSLSTNRRVFEDYLANTRQLLRLLENGQQERARSFLGRPEIHENIQAISHFLRSLPCNLFRQSRSTTTTDATSGGFNILRHFNPALAILPLMAIIAVSAGTYWGMKIRRQHKRRARRFAAHYKTSYRIKSVTFGGTLLDISGQGSKLKHSPEGTLTLGDKVDVYIADNWVAGTVVWNNTHYSGIRFDTALRHQTVRHVHETSSVTAKLAA